jgi:hypothetical protein
MTHRTCLYATDLIPSLDNAGQPRDTVALSECRYALPMIYRLLMAGTPQLCQSNFWTLCLVKDGPSEPLALIGSYQSGLGHLVHFQQSISHPTIRPMVDKIVDFLQAPHNQKPYLILEAAELLSLEQMEDDLRDEPADKLHVKIAALCAAQQGDPRASLTALAAQLNALSHDDAQAAEDKATEVLGSCSWSNQIYYMPGPNGV